MQQETKQINYCRLALEQGMRRRMRLTEGKQLMGEGGGYFSYLAPVFDTQDYDCTYHRFLLNGDFTDCKYEVLLAAVNTDIHESLENPALTSYEQAELLKQNAYIRKVNCTDFLLHELEGRYLWIYIGVSAAKTDSSFRIDSFQVEFPASSFISYLPEVYQQDRKAFFHRYMAALQTMYVDLEVQVDRLPEQLDYETASAENLNHFFSWVGFDNDRYEYSDWQRRYLLKHLQEIQGGKGTAKVLKQMLHLLTGKKVYLVEHCKWQDWMKERSVLEEEYGALYGAEESVFTVILDFTGCRKEELPDSAVLMQWIRDYSPVGTRCNLIYLQENNYMDTHCYLDVNSRLSTPIQADTSGVVLGGNYMLG